MLAICFCNVCDLGFWNRTQPIDRQSCLGGVGQLSKGCPYPYLDTVNFAYRTREPGQLVQRDPIHLAGLSPTC